MTPSVWSGKVSGMKTAIVKRRDSRKFQCEFCGRWYEQCEGYEDSEYGWQDGTTARQAKAGAQRCEDGHWDFDYSRKAALAVRRRLPARERLRRLLLHLPAAEEALRVANRALASHRRELENLPALIATQQRAYDEHIARVAVEDAEAKARGNEWPRICGTSMGDPTPRVQTQQEAEASTRQSIEYAIEDAERASASLNLLNKRKVYLERKAKA